MSMAVLFFRLEYALNVKYVRNIILMLHNHGDGDDFDDDDNDCDDGDGEQKQERQRYERLKMTKKLHTSPFDGKFDVMAMGVVKSISPPSISEMLSLEKPFVIVVSPVLDL
jgi:hypothetical protein